MTLSSISKKDPPFKRPEDIQNLSKREKCTLARYVKNYPSQGVRGIGTKPLHPNFLQTPVFHAISRKIAGEHGIPFIPDTLSKEEIEIINGVVRTRKFLSWPRRLFPISEAALQDMRQILHTASDIDRDWSAQLKNKFKSQLKGKGVPK